MKYREYEYCVHKEREELRKLKEQNSATLKALYQIPLDQAAVLLLIFQYNGRPHVILTERSQDLRTHAGMVVLPGGRVDNEDKNLIETAIREAEEEIGLDRKHVKIIGETFPLPGIQPKVVITTVVGFIEDIEAVTLKMNKNEVRDIFAVPLEYFSLNTELLFHTGTVNGVSFSSNIFNWNSGEYFKSLTKIPQNSATTSFELFNSDKIYKIYGITGTILNFYAAKIFNKPVSVSAIAGDSVETFYRNYLLNTLNFVSKLEKNKL